jgi:hypothetical protein
LRIRLEHVFMYRPYGIQRKISLAKYYWVVSKAPFGELVSPGQDHVGCEVSAAGFYLAPISLVCDSNGSSTISPLDSTSWYIFGGFYLDSYSRCWGLLQSYIELHLSWVYRVYLLPLFPLGQFVKIGQQPMVKPYQLHSMLLRPRTTSLNCCVIRVWLSFLIWFYLFIFLLDLILVVFLDLKVYSLQLTVPLLLVD